MRRHIPLVTMFAALAFFAASCASDKGTGLPAGPTDSPTTAGCSGTVEMTDQLKFVPEQCTVKVGTTVTWKDIGSVPHTSTAEPTAPVKFDSDQIARGGEFTFTFDTAGTVPYYCKLHAAAGSRAGMIGTIIVEAA